MQLSDFLLQRLDEDEAAAKAVPPPFMHRDSFSVRFDSVESVHSKADSAFVDRFDPARVLADVEAKRRIVEELVLPYIAERRRLMNGQPSWGDEHPDLLLLLALPYADHPDYRPEWKP